MIGENQKVVVRHSNLKYLDKFLENEKENAKVKEKGNDKTVDITFVGKD